MTVSATQFNQAVYTRDQDGQSEQHTRTVFSREQLISLNNKKHYTVSSATKRKLLTHNILGHRKKRRGCRGGARRRITTVMNVFDNEYFPETTKRGINKSNLIKINTSQVLKDSSNNFKIMYFNSQSVCNKTIVINDMIHESNSDLVFITETWLPISGNEVTINELIPPGYKLHSNPRIGRTGGGICVVYKDFLKIKSENIQEFSSFQCTKVTALDTTFLCVYHPPPTRKNKSTNKIFVDEMADLLNTTMSACKQVIVLGDFNLHFDSPTETYVKSMRSILDDYNLHQIIDTPTQNKGHIIDWLITNEDSPLIKDLHVADKALSDHYIVTFSLDAAKPTPKKRTVTSRNIKAIDTNAFQESLSAVFAHQPGEQNAADHYNKCLTVALDEHAPLKTRSITCRSYSPWYTLVIKQAKNQRRAAERRWRKSKLTIHKQLYQQQIKIVKDLIVEEKKKYFNDKIMNCKNTKKLFAVADEMKGNTNKAPLPTNIPTHDLPDVFGDYFYTKVSKLRECFDNDKDNESCFLNEISLIDNDISILKDFRDVSSDEIREIILRSPCKSCSLDPIPTNLLIQCLDSLIDIITSIVNQSLKTGQVPKCLKKAIISPFLKKHNLDPENLKNYRPVSNLPFLSKILEKVVLAQLKQHLQLNKLSDPFQSAYKEKHSTESALLRIMNDILRAIDSGDVTILTMLDLSAAFDTIDHSILLNRLSVNFGISGKVLSWFTSYLTERYQSVFLEGSYSSVFELNYGVPQGSVLGPVLFTMYMLPLGKIIKSQNVDYHMYADDTQLYTSAHPDNISSLILNTQNCCHDVGVWMHKNKLKLNNDKTEVLLCSTEPKLNKIDIYNITLAGTEISTSKKAKNLGVILDNTLSMEHHINATVRSIYYHLRNISRMKSVLSSDSVKTLVVSSVLARLDYCNSLLAGIAKEKISRLQRAQNCAARLLLSKPRSESSTKMLRTLHWLPVKARIEYKLAVLCYNTLQSHVPSYLKDLLNFYVPKRTLRSQDSKSLDVPKSNLKTFGDRAFVVSGPLVWNSLPLSLKSAASVEIFKRHLKKHLFQKFL